MLEFTIQESDNDNIFLCVTLPCVLINNMKPKLKMKMSTIPWTDSSHRNSPDWYRNTFMIHESMIKIETVCIICAFVTEPYKYI